MPEITFNSVCELEDLGVSMKDLDPHNLKISIIRAVFAFASGMNLEDAGKEMQAHMVAGGSLVELVDDFWKAINSSDFFQALSPTAAKGSPESESEKV
jgi:hypothetical protein